MTDCVTLFSGVQHSDSTLYTWCKTFLMWALNAIKFSVTLLWVHLTYCNIIYFYFIQFKIFSDFLETSSLNYGLYTSVLLNFQIFRDFLDILLLSISSLTMLCPENMFWVTLVVLNLTKFVVWLNLWFNLVNISMNTWKEYIFSCCWEEDCISVN